MITKDQAYKKIEELVSRFEEQYSSYKKSEYNETLTRRDFIDPFFKALGWDIDNEQGYAEAYREVIHEDKIKVGKATKAPDYSFRIGGGKRLFFVEAKKPSVDVKGEIAPAYQVRRYGWSAKLPISIITDFEEFAVYDCTKKPSPTDKASVSRTNYLTFRDYLTQFDFLWDTFSKEKVLKGSFDKYVLSTANKKGTATVDKEFLQSLDAWRTLLAESIAKSNKELDEDEINFVVQQTLDRLIFLRIAEDRGVEPYGNMQSALKHGDFYKNLFSIFRQADEKYNSGLFDFKKDSLSKDLIIENKVIKSIINQLYYPESPYEFSVLSVEILGSAYEQFLGKQITLSKSGKAIIEEKPEVRKAGGVYYTPQYIVDYIVSNTVGKLCEGKTPKQITDLTICDPACGSGSFLLGAYQYLLDWHKNYYSENGKLSKIKKDSPLTIDGNLTTAEKKRILLNNIYGVDIDVNAVEVTKLSLLLKCMEGETSASIAHQMSMFNERVLPTLDNNIKSGNSLIDLDYYSTQLDFGEEKKIKPFSWQKAFPNVFKQDGFDIVIGNPPYVRQELLGNQKTYFQTHYKAFHGMADLYSYFIEKGITLLKGNGLLGIIVANKFMRSNYGEPLRKYLKSQTVHEIIDFGDLPVFESATTYPCILIASQTSKNKTFSLANIKSLDFNSLQNIVDENITTLEISSLDDAGWNLSSEVEQTLNNKLLLDSISLGSYVKKKIYYGLKTGLNEAFVIDDNTRHELIKKDKRSKGVLKLYVAGKDIKRYQSFSINRYMILFPKGFTNKNGNKPKDAWKWLKENYTAIAEHLEPFKERGEKRFDKGDYWWELRACDYYSEFEKPKIILPDIALKMQATFDTNNFYSVNTAYIIPTDDKFLLGLLNSNVVHYYYSKISSTIRGGYMRFIRQYLETIPIKTDKTKELEIAKLVEQLLHLNIELKEANLETKKEQIQNRITYCEDRINEIVYELYGLSEEEIKIIENK